MKKSLIAAGVAAMALAGWTVRTGIAQGTKVESKRDVAFASADSASFKPGPAPGVSMATIWGDPETGPHATFTKMNPGYDAGMHTHSSTLKLVVIKGAYLYRDEAGDKRVGAGGFLRIPAGHKHWSGSDKTEGALFYEEGDGKFDKLDVK
jgi:quercetin dioxygenase-like cupin family protein